MNTKLLMLGATMLSLAGVAHAYVSGQANPPESTPEQEFRVVKKSETAGSSGEILVGHVLTFDTTNSNDGYTVTRVGVNEVTGASRIACIASKAIATGNVALNRCVSKGYVDNLKYDATTAISVGQKLCANSDGVAVVCAACVVTPGSSNNCRFGTATDNSPITALEAAASGTGTMKALINTR